MFGVVKLNQFAHVKKRRFIAHAGSLLHVVRYYNKRVVFLKLMKKLLNTVYVTTEGAALRKDGENLVAEVEGEVKVCAKLRKGLLIGFNGFEEILGLGFVHLCLLLSPSCPHFLLLQ